MLTSPSALPAVPATSEDATLPHVFRVFWHQSADYVGNAGIYMTWSAAQRIIKGRSDSPDRYEIHEFEQIPGAVPGHVSIFRPYDLMSASFFGTRRIYGKYTVGNAIHRAVNKAHRNGTAFTSDGKFRYVEREITLLRVASPPPQENPCQNPPSP